MQPPDLVVRVDHRQAVIVLEPVGEIDAYTAPVLREHMLETMSGDATNVIVDLTETGFIDSTGLAVLITGLKAMKARGGTLELVCSDANILKVLKLTGLDKVFVVHETPPLDQP